MDLDGLLKGCGVRRLDGSGTRCAELATAPAAMRCAASERANGRWMVRCFGPGIAALAWALPSDQPPRPSMAMFAPRTSHAHRRRRRRAAPARKAGGFRVAKETLPERRSGRAGNRPEGPAPESGRPLGSVGIFGRAKILTSSCGAETPQTHAGQAKKPHRAQPGTKCRPQVKKTTRFDNTDHKHYHREASSDAAPRTTTTARRAST